LGTLSLDKQGNMNTIFRLAIWVIAFGVLAACATVTAPPTPQAPAVHTVVVPQTVVVTIPRQEPQPTETQAAESTPTNAPSLIPPTPSVTQPTPSVTPPSPNPAYPLLTVRLQAIQISDDDGRRQVRITPQQVKLWVDKANEIFAKASVRFIYDPKQDFATHNSTVLNDMSGDTDANWKREVDVGNRVAAGYAGKLVVFFIHGPNGGPTGGGFSASNYNFVEMPGFDDTTVCGYQNIGILAHEVGHYFGLAHPFAMTFGSILEAESYLGAHGNDPEAFDGDGLSDTPPDPFIDIPQFQCNPKESIILNGRKFSLPRYNIMSYYSTAGVDRTDLTAQQSDTVRWVLNVRSKNGMATPTNIDVPGALQFAALPIKERINVAPSVQDMSAFGDTPRWIGDKQLFSSGQPNSTIGFSISVGTPGKYGLNLYATTAPDFGIIQTLVDGSPLATPIDLYAPIVMPSGRISIGTIDLSAGTHILGFRVAGKNSGSSGYSFGLNAFTLTPGE
jgi:hypothetical protein